MGRTLDRMLTLQQLLPDTDVGALLSKRLDLLLEVRAAFACTISSVSVLKSAVAAVRHCKWSQWSASGHWCYEIYAHCLGQQNA